MAALKGVVGEELDAVLNALGLLDLGAAGVHAALGAHSVATGHGHLLDKQHAGAAVVRAHGGGHARAAGTDDDDVIVRAVLGGGGLLRLGGRSLGKHTHACESDKAGAECARDESAAGQCDVAGAGVRGVHGSLFLVCLQMYACRRIFAARSCWGVSLAVRLVGSQHASAPAARLRPIACEMVRARGVKKLTRMGIWAGRR